MDAGNGGIKGDWGKLGLGGELAQENWLWRRSTTLHTLYRQGVLETQMDSGAESFVCLGHPVGPSM